MFEAADSEGVESSMRTLRLDELEFKPSWLRVTDPRVLAG